MAKFYLQLENNLLQLQEDLTAENISRALGYVPVDNTELNNYATKDEVSDLVDMSMVEELQWKVDNLSFDTLKDSPFTNDDSGEFNIVDEQGNIVAKIDAQGIHSIDFIAGEHVLSNKADKSALEGLATEDYVNAKIADIPEVDLSDYAKSEDILPVVSEEIAKVVANAPENFNTLKEIADYISQDQTGAAELTNRVKTLEDAGFLTEHQDISHLAEKSELPTKVSELENDKGYLTEHQNISHLASKTEVTTEINNINFYDIQDNPIVNSEEGNLIFVDESGYVGLRLEENKLYVNDVVAGNHVLSNKVDKEELNGLATESYVISKVAEAKLEGSDITIPVQDVKVNGTTVVKNMIAEIDLTKFAEKSEVPSIDGYATEAWVEGKNYLTEHQDISHLATSENLTNAMGAVQGNMNNMNKNLLDGISSVSAVATRADNTASNALTLAQGVQGNLSSFATKGELMNLDFYAIQNNPVINTEDGKLLFADESGNVGLQLESDGLYVADVIAGEHILSNKVDKVEGMGLSTEDFTTALKNKLLSLNNFDSSELESSIEGLQTQINTLVSGNATEAIETFNEIIAFLDGVKDTENLSGIIAAIEQQISNIVVPVNVSELTNDSGYITEEALTPYAKSEDIPEVNHLASKREVTTAISNIDFDHINNTPFTADESGELNIVDESGNVGFKVNEDGIYVKDVVAGEHVLSNKVNVDVITALEIRIAELESKLQEVLEQLSNPSEPLEPTNL